MGAAPRIISRCYILLRPTENGYFLTPFAAAQIYENCKRDHRADAFLHLFRYRFSLNNFPSLLLWNFFQNHTNPLLAEFTESRVHITQTYITKQASTSNKPKTSMEAFTWCHFGGVSIIFGLMSQLSSWNIQTSSVPVHKIMVNLTTKKLVVVAWGFSSAQSSLFLCLKILCLVDEFSSLNKIFSGNWWSLSYWLTTKLNSCSKVIKIQIFYFLHVLDMKLLLTCWW